MNARRLTLTTLASLCLLAVGLCCASPAALAARGHIFSSDFASAGSGPGQLDHPAGVAVNEATGDVYVVDKGNNRVERFSSSGTYLSQFDGSGLLLGEGSAAGGGGLPQPEELPTGRFSEPEGIAVDNACVRHEQATGHALSLSECEALDPSNGDVYVMDGQEEGSHLVVDKYTASGEYVGQVTRNPTDPEGEGKFREVYGVAVDSTGILWVEELGIGASSSGAATYTNARSNVFNDFRNTELSTPFSGFIRAGAFALDSQDNLYIHNSGQQGDYLSEFDKTGRLLNRKLDNEAPSGAGVEIPSNDVYVDNVTTIARFGSEGALIERLGTPGMLGTGVAVNSRVTEIYVADSTGVVHVFTLEPPSKPTVQSESLSDVTGDSATISASLNPRGTTAQYRFEYGTSPAYGTNVPSPDATVGSDYEVHDISVHLQQLTPRTEYHFRVVAHNQNGTTAGPDQTFITEPIGGELVLADGRSWEMVSPPSKGNATLEPISEQSGLIEAAAGGEAIAYVASAPVEAEPVGNSGKAEALATRASAGWETQNVTIPHASSTGQPIGYGPQYRFFAKDLARAAVQPFGAFDPALSAEASQQTAFLRSLLTGGDPSAFCSSSCYRPFATTASGYANVPAGTVLEPETGCLLGCGPQFVGASADLRHVVLRSTVGLTEDEGAGLYEWNNGVLAFLGGEALGNPEAEGARHAISEDGSRVFVRSTSGHEAHLYMRDTLKGETLELDAVRSGPGEEQPNPEFQGASSDGSRVFFTDTQKLTQTSGAGDLYECEIVERPSGAVCVLTDLTPFDGGEAAGVQGGVLGISEDGAWVYFAADGALAAGAQRQQCSAAVPGSTCNLYVRHLDTGVWQPAKLVAVLSVEDSHDWTERLSGEPARVSPDGRWLAFMSQRALTQNDNRDALAEVSDAQVFLYDASVGRLVCASCTPTGARPLGVPYRQLESGENGVTGGNGAWEPEALVAANLTGWQQTAIGGRVEDYQGRYLNDSGRLFFNSDDSLVPQDVNGTEDVYEYEPPGVGGCAASSVTFSSRIGGCVGLISAGTSPNESGFLDASESGGDVFFLTNSRLAPQDFDTGRDIYDARECTTSSPCFPAPIAQPPTCNTGDQCKAAPTPQPSSFGAPSSQTFSGAGNLAPLVSKQPGKPKQLTRAQKLARALAACRKRSAKQRATCKRRARRAYRPVRKATTKQGKEQR